MARPDGFAYFIFHSADDKEAMMLDRLEVGSTPFVPWDLVIMVHTSGEGHDTIVFLKRMKIRAQEVQKHEK